MPSMVDNLDMYAIIRGIRTVAAKPKQKFTVRGLGREARLSPGSAMACFGYMREKGMLKISRVGRAFQFNANLKHPLMREWKKLFSLDSLNSITEELLVRLGSGVTSMVLYGSMAKGVGDKKSDIDILVVTTKKKRISFSDLEAKVKRDINLSVYTPSEWREKAKKDKVFYEQVVFNCVPLFGEKPVVL